MSPTTSAEDARRLVGRSRAEQGLPPAVQDATAVERVAALLRPLPHEVAS